jgi:hypothetical protein
MAVFDKSQRHVIIRDPILGYIEVRIGVDFVVVVYGEGVVRWLVGWVRQVTLPFPA